MRRPFEDNSGKQALSGKATSDEMNKRSVMEEFWCQLTQLTCILFDFYAPNFGEVEGAYWFGPVSPSVRPSVCP